MKDKLIRFFFGCFMLLCGAVMLFSLFFLQVVITEGPSMEPTFTSGQRLLFTKSLTIPQQGDIVLIQRGNTLLVKRVLAAPGEYAEVPFKPEEGTREHIYSYWNEDENFIGPVPVPEGYLFVMGDNPDNSYDSRNHEFGLVAIDEVVGVLLYPKD